MRVMFDTNVFSNIANLAIDPARIPSEWRPVATYLQWQEIQATKDLNCRAQIAAVFESHLPEKVRTIAVWDVTAFDESEWATSDSAYQSILTEMNRIRRHRNNPIDAVIAEARVREGLALVTNDRTLAQVASAHGVQVFNVQS
jgi:rRNA-processing protein FCF1